MSYETGTIFVHFETRATFQVVGMQVTCYSSLLPILLPPLWQVFSERVTTISYRHSSNEIFSICRKRGEEETWCLGVAASATQDLLDGMVGFEIPGQRYAVFRYKGPRGLVAGAYEEVRKWREEHADEYRVLPIPQAFPFEVYQQTENDGQIVCEIFLPIEREIAALRGLDDIDWSQLRGCYNTMEMIPDTLRQLVSEDAQERKNAFVTLHNELTHQGSLYTASAAVAPFLSRLLNEPGALDKLNLLELLTMFAQGYRIDDKPFRPRPFPFIYGEGEDEEGKEDESMKGQRLEAEWRKQTHEAVREGLAYYLPFLSSADPQLCLAAICLLGCFKEDRARIVPQLLALLAKTTSEHIRLYSLTCLGALLTADDKETMELAAYLDDRWSQRVGERAAMAICAAMKERISEEMIEKILATQIYPLILNQDYNKIDESLQYVDWIDHHSRYYLGLMSIITSTNRFVPQRDPLPSRFKEIARMMGTPFQDEEFHYPEWFSGYAEQVGSMLLRFCFLEEKVSEGSQYTDLNERQQRLLGMLAECNAFWPDKRPYKMLDIFKTKFEPVDIPDEMRPTLPRFRIKLKTGYQKELDHSEIVQLLRKIGLPDTQEAVQEYVRH